MKPPVEPRSAATGWSQPAASGQDDRSLPGSALPTERLLLKAVSVRGVPVSRVRQSERSAGAAERGPEGRLALSMTVSPQT